MGQGPSGRFMTGRGTLGEVRDGLVDPGKVRDSSGDPGGGLGWVRDPVGGPGLDGGTTRKSGRGRWTHPEVLDESGDSRGGPERVGGPSGRFETGRRTLGAV